MREMNRVQNFKLILWTIIGVGAAVAAARFIFGLGATTNLSDAVPWGLWIGFDVMSGVALAGGGFVITATVYIFKLDKYHGIVRPAVLTALLGYVAVAVGLLFDLGLPWNIWHMIIFWNPHSPLFEVGWCVMLYLTVLLLEFFPVPAAEFGWLSTIRNFLIKLRMPLVIAGIALSTLHQSSLGSLFLVMPFNVHPLWYSPIMPIMFFVSAIGLGLMMVSFESRFTSYLYRKEAETELLAKLGNAAKWIFLLYLLMRFGDLFLRGQIGHIFAGGWQVKMFWVEIAISAAIPLILLSIKRVRTTGAWQWVISIMAITGIVLNRINVGGMVHLNRGDTFYLPAWTEITITATVVAGAALVFLFMVERFNVWEVRPVDPKADPSTLPEFDYASQASLGRPLIAARTKYSLAFVFAAAFGFMLLSNQSLSSEGVIAASVEEARGGDTLWVDGDLDGYGVSFQHQMHIDKNGNETSCVQCHHMNLPLDENTGCYACHRDMYIPTDAFGHDWHSSPHGGNLSCFKCHQEDQHKNAETAQQCDHCHDNLYPAGATIKVDNYHAPGYVDALHELCIGCHVKLIEETGSPDIARCANCHNDQRDVVEAVDGTKENILIGNVALP